MYNIDVISLCNYLLRIRLNIKKELLNIPNFILYTPYITKFYVFVISKQNQLNCMIK